MAIFKLGLFLIALFFLLSFSARAFIIDHKGELSLSNYYRTIPQTGLSELNSSVDTVLLAGFQFRAMEPHLQLEVRPEVRGLVGQSSHLNSQDLASISIRSPPRALQLGGSLTSQDNAVWYGDFERLNFAYNTDTFEIYVGRKPMSLGVLKAFPVWNKFTRPMPGTTGPVLIFGSDGAGIRYQSGPNLVRALSMIGATQADSVYLSEFTWYGNTVEFHILGGSWWETTAFGGAFSKNLGGFTVNGECLLIENDFQSGFGAEYAFSESWDLLWEFLFQSKGAKSPAEYTVLPSSRFYSLRGMQYTFMQMNYHLNSVWTFSGGSLLSQVDWSAELLFKAIHSWSQNIDLVIQAATPTGPEGTEFSKKTISYPNGSSFGFPVQFLVSLVSYF
jgi:hypothetical protein